MSTLKKSLLIVLCCVIVAGFVSAAEKDLNFTYVSPIIGHPYWVQVDDGVTAAAKAFGVNVTITGPTKVDANEQIQYLETAIAEKVDGIITMALNPASFTPVINKAMDAGIPVMILDGDAPDSKRLAFFGSNNYNAGIVVAETMEQLSDGKAKIGVITAGIDIKHIMDRVDGMEEYFKDKPNMEIVAIEDTRADTIIAMEKTTAMLQGNPDINVVFGAGAADSPGVAKAIEDLNLVGKVVVVGFDDIPQTLDYVRKGVIQACIAQKPYGMGYMAVEALYKTVVNGEKITGVLDTGVTVVTQENIDTYKDQ